MHEHTRVAHTEHTASAQDKQLCDMLGRSAYLNVFPFTLREQVIVIAFGITPPPIGPADARRNSVLQRSGAPALRPGFCRRLMSPSSPLVFPFTLRRPVIAIERGITAPLVEPADARRYPVLQRSRAPALRRGLSAPPDGRPNGRRGSGLRCSGAPEGQCRRVDSGAPALRRSSATGGGRAREVTACISGNLARVERDAVEVALRTPIQCATSLRRRRRAGRAPVQCGAVQSRVWNCDLNAIPDSGAPELRTRQRERAVDAHQSRFRSSSPELRGLGAGMWFERPITESRHSGPEARVEKLRH